MKSSLPLKCNTDGDKDGATLVDDFNPGITNDSH